MSVHVRSLLIIGAAALAVSVPLASSPAVVRSTGAREAMLTPVAWLAEHLHDANLVILQVGDAATYPHEHVPGARAADMARFAAPGSTGQTPSGLRLEMPDDDAVRTTLESFGISDDSRIVIVESDNWFSPSTRIYLTLVHAGFGVRTTLLDGGLAAWKAAGQATTAEVPPERKGTIASLKTVKVVADAVYVQAHEKTPGVAILDVRSLAAWDGTDPVDSQKPPRYGHIPGSRSLPLEDLWDDAGSRLKPAADLEKRFAEAGVQSGDTVVAYCYIGQRATATLFAAQSLGHPVLLYDGSMDEWAKLKLPLEMPNKKGMRAKGM